MKELIKSGSSKGVRKQGSKEARLMESLGRVILVWISDVYIARYDLQLHTPTREGDAHESHESCGQNTKDPWYYGQERQFNRVLLTTPGA